MTMTADNTRKAVLVSCNDMPFLLADFNSYVVGGCEPNAELSWLFDSLTFYHEDRHIIPGNWCSSEAEKGYEFSDDGCAFEVFEETLMDILGYISSMVGNKSFTIIDTKSANLTNTQVLFVLNLIEQSTAPI